MMGTGASLSRFSALRMYLLASYPSMMGMLQSMKMTSYSSRLRGGESARVFWAGTALPFASKSISRHSEPFHAIVTLCPSCCSIVVTTSMLNSLSSTTSTSAALAGMHASVSSAAEKEKSSHTCSASSTTSSVLSTFSSLRVKVKVEPSPYLDETEMLPPISSTSCLQMASPSPTPSGLRTRLSWILVNMPNSLTCAASSMPMPVSATEMEMKWYPAISASSASSTSLSTERVMPPLMVNLTALYRRLSSTCRSLCWSPRT
mmetsp:Transcript_15731/g.50716  ORF Transcript_15731/g.50716 Transcript_15731/m.50716 type:complete len:261 (+) Transcript_15731:2951-3733(+)